MDIQDRRKMEIESLTENLTKEKELRKKERSESKEQIESLT